MPALPKKRPFVLIVRDGWGANPHPEWNHANAVYLAKTPVDERLMKDYPHVQIKTCGEDVGLPVGIMGNSEVGHQNIGAGRIVDQELLRITKTIRDGSFFENETMRGAFARAKETGGNVHILGLCSDAGVHSVLAHLYGILELANRLDFDGDRVFLHAFSDGRDSPPTAGIDFIHQIEAKMKELGVGRVASVIGRYYAMDRDNRWDRVERAYRLLTEAKGTQYKSAAEAFQAYYDNPIEPSCSGDEFVEPGVMVGADGKPLATIGDGDSVIFFNYRGDRPRELSKAFTLDEFPFEGVDKDGTTRTMGFDRPKKLDVYFATMTAYETGLPVKVIFNKPPKMKNIFGQYISELGLTQFRSAETEKFPHVTFFFNDYRDEPFEGEDRQIVPSPRDVSTYDQKPEMSAYPLTEKVLAAIESKRYDAIIVNYANGDMVGHTGNLQAAIEAVQAVDECVGKVVDATLAQGGCLIVSADHGNCEQMIDPKTNKPHTSHTVYDVEAIVVDDDHKGAKLREGGRLADLMPTALAMMGLEKPEEMTGQSLIP
ncbi:MAG: 2,3-bisphosphoglycerate-independent phosphoglycerate mutase [Phycisphaerae bacterium]|nr:2,3-bisphosphoglycerate-independent phosphoglycerate mutase [Phycisphaerales bacterium]